MTIEEFLVSAELELKRCFIAEGSYLKYIRDLTKAYEAGRNQNLEEWKVLEKNYDDLYTRERWTFLKTKDDLPSPRDDRKVLTWFKAGAGQPGGATVLAADRFSEGGGVIAWKEITPPEGVTL